MFFWQEKTIETIFEIVPKKVKVKIAQSCLTLYDLMDYTVYRILQAEYWHG